MTSEPEEQAARFYDGAERRLMLIMPLLAVAAAAGLARAYGLRFGLGVMAGSIVAYANFYWLRRIVSGLADRATFQGRPSGAGILIKFLIRYALLALAAYAILSVSLVSLYGFLCGLFLPVAGIMVEAGYELYVSQRHGL